MVSAAVAGLGAKSLASLGRLDLDRLQGFLGLTNVADRSLFRNAGDVPVAVVMAAEERALFLTLSDEEQQVAVVRLHIEDGDLRVDPWLAMDLEELAFPIGLDIERKRPGHARPMNRTVGNLEARAKLSKREVEKVPVHEGEGATGRRRVR